MCLVRAFDGNARVRRDRAFSRLAGFRSIFGMFPEVLSSLLQALLMGAMLLIIVSRELLQDRHQGQRVISIAGSGPAGVSLPVGQAGSRSRR